jgi:hypothetical protein
LFVSGKFSKVDSFLEVWLLRLVMPVGTLQPSLVVLGAAASFLIAFCLTFCFQASLPQGHGLQPSLIHQVSFTPSVGLLSGF